MTRCLPASAGYSVISRFRLQHIVFYIFSRQYRTAVGIRRVSIQFIPLLRREGERVALASNGAPISSSPPLSFRLLLLLLLFFRTINLCGHRYTRQATITHNYDILPSYQSSSRCVSWNSTGGRRVERTQVCVPSFHSLARRTNKEQENWSRQQQQQQQPIT